ncbi:methionyl-tRNA formyltransferase [Desulfoluna butyratoxydans]|uniref:Formyl transferase n=1 Tax=Desulfoluna butyratoxydans TaxID=231438 RepID=A0A4U8YU01_9BACT|nr:formyltransferase family protein [Desulfoluna butyratoxydans]VFQ47451.1 formyl transferase [Desulfoluna butyratoxydans]
MKRFVLIGEEYAAFKIAKILYDKEGAQLVAVFTNLTKKGPLILFCEQNGIELFDSSTLSNEETIERIRSSCCDWLINILSAVIIPVSVLRLFPGRAINLHTGPLPDYAGIHVHQWGIRNGESEFGVTVHFMEECVDTGDIIAERRFLIEDTDTGLSLFNKAVREGSLLFQDVLSDIVSGRSLPSKKQDTCHRKLYRVKDALDSCIDWNEPARCIINFVRAGNYHPFVSPTYTASIDYAGNSVSVLHVQLAGECEGPPGRLHKITGLGPVIACGKGEGIIVTHGVDQSGVLNYERWVQFFDTVSTCILGGEK